MKSVYLSILCLVLIFPSSAQESVFSLKNEIHQRIRVGQPFNQSAQIEPFPDENPISALAISGQLTLNSDSSLIRMILLDDRYNEYLVFESYSPLAELGTFSIDQIGEETILLNQLVPSSIRLEIHDATLVLNEIITSGAGTKKTGISKEELQQKQLQAKINKINDNLTKRSIPWIAGETSISRMTFEEKKAYFGGEIPNLGGLEYYTGGLFVLPGILDVEDSMGSRSPSADIETSSLVKEFSWRNVHGQDWVTPVKNQGGCNSCWAFGATAATELLANLYFNRHIDHDLSEQNLISCTSGNCSLGAPVSLALDYIKNTGIITEECFPYTASDQDCSEICSEAQDRIQIGNYNFFHKEDDKKRAVLSGATSANVSQWAHAVQVVGYKLLEEGDTLFVKNEADTSRWILLESNHPLINQTAWLCKNSWGENWGDEGYVYLLGNEQDIMMYSLHGPVSSLIYNDVDIICSDGDGDGYYTWGNGPKPAHCPDSPPEPDGDDTNRCVGPRDEYGNFTSTTPVPEAMDTVIVGDQTVPDLFASGENIRWYSDKKLLNPVHQGNVYPTGLEDFGDYTMYATQTVSGCESTANAVNLFIWQEVPRPFGHDTIIKKGEPALLSAHGEPGAILKWYGDPMLTDSLFTGEVYDSQRLDTGIYTYFVTQTICKNESAPDTLVLRIADLVYIPDQTFLQALLKEGVDTNNDGIISYTEAGEVTSLDVGSGIWDLTGIEAFVNLDTLYCTENYISHLNLSNSHALRYLDCSENRLKSLDVSANTSLKYLNCSRNEITELDASACTLLEYLNCSVYTLTDLDVSACTSLLNLDCSYTQISDLDVSACLNLQKIDCHWSALTHLDVRGLLSLQTIACHLSDLTHLDVSGCASLQSIECHLSDLTHLDVAGCVSLQTIDAHRCELTHLDVSGCVSLQHLECHKNYLLNLDVSDCKNLLDLNCQDNQLTSLDLSACDALQTLKCGRNQLTSLDLSGHPALQQLHCVSNQLSILEFSNSAKLDLLDCSLNQLISLDASGCMALTGIFCSNNQLTSMDLDNCTSLKALVCNTNNLNSLELSTCVALKTLYCNNNQFSSLALPESLNLSALLCNDNQLHSLDVSNCNSLRLLHCNGNLLERLDLSNNPEIGSGENDYPELSIANMPMLKEVCVWTMPFPPVGVNVDTTGSPNVEFQDCSNDIEENETSDFSVYPNPSSGLFTIETNYGEDYLIKVFTPNGCQIYEESSGGKKHLMDLSSFPQGVYLIGISIRNSTAWKKVITL